MTDFDDPDFDYDGQGKSKYQDAMAGTYVTGIMVIALIVALAVVAGALIWILS